MRAEVQGGEEAPDDLLIIYLFVYVYICCSICVEVKGWFSSFPCARDPTQVVGHIGWCLYRLTHPASPDDLEVVPFLAHAL